MNDIPLDKWLWAVAVACGVLLVLVCLDWERRQDDDDQQPGGVP